MDKIAKFFLRRRRVMLQFSAGKDSAACLHLLRPFWERLHVVWMNPGNPTQAVLEYMEGVRKLVPTFHEVRGNQPAWIAEHGYPVDVLPFGSTYIGINGSSRQVVRFCRTEECCGANLWQPLARFVLSGGYDGIIRGQKLHDELKSPVRSGDVIEGIEYFFPIESWTDREVFEYLGPDLPPGYAQGLRTSIDCRNCTAYAQEHKGIVESLAKSEPDAAAEIRFAHHELAAQLTEYLDILKEC